MREIKKVLLKSLENWFLQGSFRESATLSFFAILALPALFIVIITLGGLLLEGNALSLELQDFFAQNFGQPGLLISQQLLNQTEPLRAIGLTTAIAFAVVLISATSLFTQLQYALNRIFGVAPKKVTLHYIVFKKTTALLVLGMTSALTIASVLLETLAIISTDILIIGENSYFSVHLISALSSLVIVIFLVALFYKLLPDAYIGWREVGVGAVATALLLTFGKYIIGAYIAQSVVVSAFGATNALIGLALWLYYSFAIVLLGAEFTKNYAQTFGTKIKPTPEALRRNSWRYKLFH